MTKKWQIKKPKSVLYAQWALWAWTSWICLFGIIQSWLNIPALQKMIAEQLQGQIFIESETILGVTVGFYALLALSMVWIIFKIDQGKNWARMSILISLALQLFMTLKPPYHEIMGYLPDIPDIGLQFYAVFLLFTWPGRTWFNREEWATDLET